MSKPHTTHGQPHRPGLITPARDPGSPTPAGRQRESPGPSQRARPRPGHAAHSTPPPLTLQDGGGTPLARPGPARASSTTHSPQPGRQQTVPKGRGLGHLTDQIRARLTPPRNGGGAPRAGSGQRGPTSPSKFTRDGSTREHPRSD